MMGDTPRCWQCDGPITSGQATVSAVLTISLSGRGRALLLHAACVEQPQVLLVPCPPCLTALVTGTDTEPHACEEQPLLAIDGGAVLVPRDAMLRHEDGDVLEVDEVDAVAAARATARALVAQERARRAALAGEGA